MHLTFFYYNINGFEKALLYLLKSISNPDYAIYFFNIGAIILIASFDYRIKCCHIIAVYYQSIPASLKIL